MSDSPEELHDVDQVLFIDLRKEFNDVAPNEGEPLDHVYLKLPEGKLPRDLIKQEIQENHQEVRKVKVREFNGLYGFGCSKRRPRNKSHNAIDARWGATCKMIGGNVGAKCRLTVRCFNDKFQDLYTYVWTISRSGKRVANAIAAEHQDVVLFSFDVSQVFANGFISEEISDLIGTEVRAVQFDVPNAGFD